MLPCLALTSLALAAALTTTLALLALLTLTLLSLALLTTLAAALLATLARAGTLRAGEAAIGVAYHFVPGLFFLACDIFICLRGFRWLIGRINRLTGRCFGKGFRALLIQMTATFLIQTINRFDFAAHIRPAAPVAAVVNINIFENITRIAAALRTAIIIFRLVCLARLRVILRGRIGNGICA